MNPVRPIARVPSCIPSMEVRYFTSKSPFFHIFVFFCKGDFCSFSHLVHDLWVYLDFFSYGTVFFWLWKLLVAPGGSWWLLVAPGGSWWLLVAPGGSWWLLVAPGGSWWLLVAPGGSWWLLVAPGGSCGSWFLVGPGCWWVLAVAPRGFLVFWFRGFLVSCLLIPLVHGSYGSFGFFGSYGPWFLWQSRYTNHRPTLNRFWTLNNREQTL